ncbi:MAG: 9-O-acetylesterase [Muribaculaceae bacterium]|nr:9-O-acetylesterase [Muribaculaceae bacterium]
MKKICLLGLSLFAAASASAVVTLPQFITDNMVMQQNSTMKLPGKAKPGSKVTVKTDWFEKELTAKAGADGVFSIDVPTPAAGGPFTMILSDGDGEPTVLCNLLSGEVWLCSGQSNMEFKVNRDNWGSRLMNSDEIVATSQHPDIRLLKLSHSTSYAPADDANVEFGGWVEANPATMGVSAIGYLFALRMHDELGVPVGIIDSSWGGTVAEAWTPYTPLESVPGFESQLAMLKSNGFDAERINKIYNQQLAQWSESLNKAGRKFDRGVMQTGAEWGKMPLPGIWENSVLPGFDGLVWIQRELELPAEAAGKPLALEVGVVDDLDDTYFNGVRVGGYENPGQSRVYEVPGNLVKAGKNVITVKIVDFMGEGGVKDGSKMAAAVDGKTYPLNGEWSYCADMALADMPRRPSSPQGPNYPTVLYNAMINPLRVLPLKGVLWYQGCSNVGRAEQYEPLFKTLINSWRATFDNPEMPFYFVQLAGYLPQQHVQPDAEYAHLRNSQAKALELPNTGMAVAIDLGHPTDIHPSNKQEVARRLALIALNRDYGKKDVVYKAPALKSAKADGNKMVLKFDGAVKPSSLAVLGFTLGDGKGKFVYANARMQGDDTIIVSSPLIEKPSVVRYNWANYPGGNLYGPTGLPVAPFATDL